MSFFLTAVETPRVSRTNPKGLADPWGLPDKAIRYTIVRRETPIHRTCGAADTMTRAFRSNIDLRRIKIDPSWSFADCTQTLTRYISHGYHTFPAKFIPQLAARLICEWSAEGDVVVDPFMGSGTTIVEALVHQRIGVGVDINPVALLIAKTKATPLEPAWLDREFARLRADLTSAAGRRGRRMAAGEILPQNERIDYWFPAGQKEKLGALLGRIMAIRRRDVRDFFLVAFSQILKSCSIWLQRSIKPTRDHDKTPAEPFEAFLRQAQAMIRRNQQMWKVMPARVREDPSAWRTVECRDARSLPLTDGAAKLIVTSPPYVTSYEYADLHQLTALWFNYCRSLPEFRRGFIGSAHSEKPAADLRSQTAERICAGFAEKKKAQEVRSYFSDMLECFAEMKRVLKVGGIACIVIGDTRLQGIDVLNGQVFVEQMVSLGFGIRRIVKRSIPSKILPQKRDPSSGRFTSSTNARVLAYPTEHILIMEKMSKGGTR